LTGSETGEGRYSGDYNDPISGESGSWTLERSKISGVDQGTETELSRWFSIWQELSSIETEIQTAQKQVDEQRQSIDDLHSYVSDGDTLRKTADVRLGRADSEIDAARDDLRERQRRLDRELRDFDLSQRISQEGRLVFLSRETIQRESRWIELTLKLLEPETSIGFDQALERAERVKALKHAIAKERAAPRENPEQTPTPSALKRDSEADKEEEFYGQLE
jgi:septal ring factor EnvC (AmiA/AmiB activator)